MLSKGSYLKCLQLPRVTSRFFNRGTEGVRFARELIGEVHLEGLSSVSLSMLGIACHSAPEGWLGVSPAIESCNIQPHSSCLQSGRV